MSLDWSIAKCRNLTEIGPKAVAPIEWFITESLIWRCLGLDMGGLRHEKDVDEMWFRLQHSNWIPKIFLNTDCTESYTVTKDDIARRIGLNTNVKQLTRKQWLAKYTRRVEREH